jgi:hypothetical protein
LNAAQDRDTEAERRISRIIHDYEQQGFHRTGTTVDQQSADWLSEEVRAAGLVPLRESFRLSRVDLGLEALIADDRRVEGIPLFDARFTDLRGITGRLGPLGGATEIGLAESAPNAAASGPLGEARRSGRHTAIVCVTRGARPGLCPSNADSFLQPFGPPVLQVSSEHGSWLSALAQRGEEVQLIAQVTRTDVAAVNVTTTITGTDSDLPPLVVMTPRSGWYSCASERGGGIACWLEVMRALAKARSPRTVLFVASSGHELGHLGINAFVEQRPGIVRKAVAWMHFGASIGAATDPGNTLQASGDDLDALLSGAMAGSGLSIDRRIPRSTIPAGEAEVVHRGGGWYVSVIGRNALFHNPEDRGPQAVDPSTIARFVRAFTSVATKLAGA